MNKIQLIHAGALLGSGIILSINIANKYRPSVIGVGIIDQQRRSTFCLGFPTSNMGCPTFEVSTPSSKVGLYFLISSLLVLCEKKLKWLLDG